MKIRNILAKLNRRESKKMEYGLWSNGSLGVLVPGRCPWLCSRRPLAMACVPSPGAAMGLWHANCSLGGLTT